jgi:hypothetical protein
MSFAFKRFSFFGQHDVPGGALPGGADAVCTGGGRVFSGADGGSLHVLDAAGFGAVAALPAFGHRLMHLAWAEVRQGVPGSGGPAVATRPGGGRAGRPRQRPGRAGGAPGCCGPGLPREPRRGLQRAAPPPTPTPRTHTHSARCGSTST